jgi:hypothetical protein
MNTTNTPSEIKLNSTFMRLSTGATSIADVIAQRASARAKDDSAVIRRHELAEGLDPYSANFCQ